MVSLTVYSVMIFSHRYLDSDLLHLKFFVLLLFIGPSEHYHTTQIPKFNNKCLIIEPLECQTMSLIVTGVPCPQEEQYSSTSAESPVDVVASSVVVSGSGSDVTDSLGIMENFNRWLRVDSSS